MVQEEVQKQSLMIQHQAGAVKGMELRVEGLTQTNAEILKKLDQLLGKDERGKKGGTPASKIVTETGGRTPPSVFDGSRKGEGEGSEGHTGSPELVFGSFDGGNLGKGRYDYRQRKIDMTTFDGTDPDGWILQAECYFAIYQLINEEKVEAAVLSLSGDALAKQRPLSTWEEMKTLFLQKF